MHEIWYLYELIYTSFEILTILDYVKRLKIICYTDDWIRNQNEEMQSKHWMNNVIPSADNLYLYMEIN